MLNSSPLEIHSKKANGNQAIQNLQPFLKWAGGKRQLLPRIRTLLPVSFHRYFEPFIGAGAVCFDLQHPNAVINDYNLELINCYEVIRDTPDELIQKARSYSVSKEQFYLLREMDRKEDYQLWTPVERAARLIYLNRTCFNGLFRVNSRGYFNVPYGDYKNPKIIDEGTIRAVHEYLNSGEVQIRQGDFADAVSDAAEDDFIYFDPPYDPLSETSSFTSYSHNAFGREEQLRLRSTCDELNDRGCKFLVSNSATDFVRELYSAKCYRIVEVEANRNINSVGTGRQKIGELLIYNRYTAVHAIGE